MMRITYSGPKVLFGEHGMSFDNNKDDKFVYLNIATQLHQALSHEYEPGHTYQYDTQSKRLASEEIMAYFEKIMPDSAKLVEKAQKEAEDFVQNEKHKVEVRNDLNEAASKAWLANIELMKDYVMQRRFNKAIYYQIIHSLSRLIIKHKISQINTPMYQKFVHVLHSLQGVLKSERPSIDSIVEFYDDKGTLNVRLVIKR
jgi:DNA-binding phage protein